MINDVEWYFKDEPNRNNANFMNFLYCAEAQQANKNRQISKYFILPPPSHPPTGDYLKNPPAKVHSTTLTCYNHRWPPIADWPPRPTDSECAAVPLPCQSPASST